MTYKLKKIGLDTVEFWFYFNKITNECKYIDALLNRSNINCWKEIDSKNINIAIFKSGFGGALFDRGCLTSCES